MPGGVLPDKAEGTLMNYRMVWQVLGRVLCIEAALMILPMVTALCYGETPLPFLISAAATGLVGLILWRVRARNAAITAREGFLIVGLSWVFMALFGALPFVIGGEIPNYLDALFEMVSGLTTTGASILTDIEALSHGAQFWRLFAHWIGGMGILVFIMAILPMAGNRSMHIMRAEVPGPTVGKLVPRIRKTARILYLLYIVMTVVETLLLLCGGMSFFDALVHSFATAGTGGFSTRALSIGYYDSTYIDVVTGTFMILFGVNFSLYFLVIIGDVREALRSEELRWFGIIVAASVCIIAVDIFASFQSVGLSLRHALFQVSSIISTTGFATVDFAQWPVLSHEVLLLLMLIGSCAGSTGGGIKISRVVICVKSFAAELHHMLHPHAVTVVRLDRKAIDKETLIGTRNYLIGYVLIIILVSLLLAVFDDAFDFLTHFSATMACFNNIGPGLSVVGPMSNYAAYSPASKLLLSLAMLAGRLEVFPIVLLFSPRTWRRSAG